ncbi:MAG: dihydroorotase [Betaproteobacteria bacterium]|nr:dihydroorotase [Betaproteobacteria bacterium]
MTLQHFVMTQPDDWHLHLRDGEMLKAVLPYTARQFARAIVMPNLKPPVTTVGHATAYAQRIRAALPTELIEQGVTFEPLMTLYLTDQTAAEEIQRAKDSGIVQAVKLYPAGATTNSESGVTDLNRCSKALEAMQKNAMVLCIHGEVTHQDIDVFDREAVFIDRVLIPLRHRFPELRIVFEHITTRQAAEYVQSASGPIAATITPQHLLYNRNALFQGGIRPHYYCLPVLKREVHRQALLAAATGGSPKFFLGTDSAPHEQAAKETACGCAGCFSAPFALELYAQAFASVDALDRLEAFASFYGPDFYGLPRNTKKIKLSRVAQKISSPIAAAGGFLVPLGFGEPLEWQFEGPT